MDVIVVKSFFWVLLQHKLQLSVDFLHKENLYWTDHGLNLIEIARLNGMYRSVVISEGLDQPRAITVHPQRGYVTVPESLRAKITHWFSYKKSPSLTSLQRAGSQSLPFGDVSQLTGICLKFRVWSNELNTNWKKLSVIFLVWSKYATKLK